MKKIALYIFFVIPIAIFAQGPCSLDNSFDTDGKLIGDGSRITDNIIALPNGKSIIAYNPFSSGHVYLRRLNADGTIDNSFGTNGKTTLQVASSNTQIKDMLLYNNQIYVCGTTNPGSNTYPFFARLNLNG
jgi:hypothetical protein